MDGRKPAHVVGHRDFARHPDRRPAANGVLRPGQVAAGSFCVHLTHSGPRNVCFCACQRRNVVGFTGRNSQNRRSEFKHGISGQITVVSNIHSSEAMHRLNVAKAETGSQVVVEVWKGCSVIKVAAGRMKFAHRPL